MFCTDALQWVINDTALTLCQSLLMQSVQTRAGIEVEFARAGYKSDTPHNFIVVKEHKIGTAAKAPKNTLVIGDHNSNGKMGVRVP